MAVLVAVIGIAGTADSARGGPPAGEPVAAFAFECGPLVAGIGQAPYWPCAFHDASVPGAGGEIVAWQWDFGDGTTSAERDPTHDFLAPDHNGRVIAHLHARVRLTVTDASGATDSATRTINLR